MKEPRRTLLKGLLFITIGLLLLASTHALTWDITTNEGCVHFEPLGSCPETGTNTIRETGTGTNYRVSFDYNSSDTNITYNIYIKANGTNFCYSPLASSCFTIESDHPESASKTNIYRGAEFNPQGQFLIGSAWIAKSTSESTYKFENASVQGRNLIVYQNTTYCDGTCDEIIYKYNISIKGKTLITDVTANKRQVLKTDYGRIQTPNQIISLFEMDNLTMQMRNYTSPLIINNGFYLIGSILDLSNYAYEYNGRTYNENSTKVRMIRGSQYVNLTDAYPASFHDTYFVIYSPDIKDVFLHNANNVATNYATAKNLFYVESLKRSASYSLNNVTKLIERYKNYGFDVENAVVTVQQFAEPLPDLCFYESPHTQAVVTSFDTNMTNLGVTRWGIYNSLQDIYPSSGFYNSSGLNCSIDMNASDGSYFARDSNNATINAWFESDYGGQSLMSKYDKRYEMFTKILLNNMTSWGSNVIMLDTEGATYYVDKYVDLTHNGYQAGKRKEQRSAQQLYSDLLSDNGFLTITESGVGGFYASGVFDVITGGYSSGRNQTKKGVLSYWYDTEICSHSVCTLEYPGRFFTNWSSFSDNWDDENYVLTRESDLDRYVVEGAATRKTLKFMNHDVHNIPENLSILLFYSLRELNQLYNGAVLVDEVYGDLTISQAAIAGYDFLNPRLQKNYSNGLRVYANLNRSGWWNFTANGKSINLAPNGLYAYDGSGFEECYNCDNTTHYVIVPGSYVYVYPKGGSVSVSVPEEYYDVYHYYGDDSTNGRRLVGDDQLLTSITTAEVTYLQKVDYITADSAATRERVELGFLGTLELFMLVIFVIIATTLILLIKGDGGVDVTAMIIMLVVVSFMAYVGLRIAHNLAIG